MAHRAISEAVPVVDRVRPYLVPALVVAVLVAAGWWLQRPTAAPVESLVPQAAAGRSPGTGTDTRAEVVPGASPGPDGTAGSTTTMVPDLVVQAAGAVRHPGVYDLAPGSRIVDLVRAAGGLDVGADRARINLAAPVADGERVWLPRTGETEVPDLVAGGGGGSPGGGVGTQGSGPAGSGRGGGRDGGPAPGAPVDLNTATEAELDALPGVGPATAAAILAYRDQVGRFSSVEDLLEVRGIGDAKLEQLRPLVTV